ncbi:hypothetical protein EJ08DRAFT_431798 [Tothia fuscella]|uniref:Uncharacterized protein n=1 Tax=Tothia fuscella TaxID=1048955 RepID=A0A9P4U2S6_9PEZI|nr:hypothetical protein EJ08DRAFT_431798 [Tothia fuscella]
MSHARLADQICQMYYDTIFTSHTLYFMCILLWPVCCAVQRVPTILPHFALPHQKPNLAGILKLFRVRVEANPLQLLTTISCSALQCCWNLVKLVLKFWRGYFQPCKRSRICLYQRHKRLALASSSQKQRPREQ